MTSVRKRLLNEGKECSPVLGRMSASRDGRGIEVAWTCGACQKPARQPLETLLRVVEKQCDFCLANNVFRFD
jgi:hypothetical protein